MLREFVAGNEAHVPAPTTPAHEPFELRGVFLFAECAGENGGELAPRRELVEREDETVLIFAMTHEAGAEDHRRRGGRALHGEKALIGRVRQHPRAASEVLYGVLRVAGEA